MMLDKQGKDGWLGACKGRCSKSRLLRRLTISPYRSHAAGLPHPAEQRVNGASEVAGRAQEPRARIGFELLELLSSYHVLRLLSERQVNSATTLGPMEDMVLARALEQDVVLRLCKLDDDDNRSWSLREFARFIRKRGHSELADRAMDQLRHYRRILAPLKTHHRNVYMAHVSKSRPQSYRPLVELHEAIGVALRVYDDLTGEFNEFSISQPGNDEERLDLRCPSWLPGKQPGTQSS